MVDWVASFIANHFGNILWSHLGEALMILLVVFTPELFVECFAISKKKGLQWRLCLDRCQPSLSVTLKLNFLV